MGTLVKIFHLNARTPAIISSPWKIDHKRPLNQSQADLSQSWDAVLLTREGYSLCVRKISFKSYCHYRVLLFAFREYTKGKGVNVVAAENNVYHFKLFELFNRCRRDKKKGSGTILCHPGGTKMFMQRALSWSHVHPAAFPSAQRNQHYYQCTNHSVPKSATVKDFDCQWNTVYCHVPV